MAVKEPVLMRQCPSRQLKRAATTASRQNRIDGLRPGLRPERIGAHGATLCVPGTGR